MRAYAMLCANVTRDPERNVSGVDERVLHPGQ